MSKSTLWSLLAVLSVVVIVGGSFWWKSSHQPIPYSTSYTDTTDSAIDSVESKSLNQKVNWTTYKSQNLYSSKTITCVDTPKYFVVTNTIYDFDGEDILVKYKTKVTQIIPCEYKVEKGDFEIKNKDADRFEAITNNLLIQDSGSAPSFGHFTIYDLDQQKEIYNAGYGGSIGDIENGFITYWGDSDQTANTENCPGLSERPYDYLYGANIYVFTTLNLSTLSKTLGEYICSPVQ